jgi:4-amino-4-deoxy-L-arabinose transferase-like glycosyltransferase
MPIRSRLASSIKTAVAVTAATVSLLLVLKATFARIHMPFQLDYEEGNMLNAAVRILHGQALYTTPGSFPYIIIPYGPLGYIVSAIGIGIFGTNLLGPRLLVLLAALASAILIALCARAMDASWSAACIAALSYVCLPSVSYWLPLLRVDFFAILLSLLGLYVFVRFPLAWPVSAAIFGLAILTKQTALAAPTAVFVELIAQKKTGKAFATVGIELGLILLFVFVLGTNFTFAFLGTHPDPYSFKHALNLFSVAIQSCILVLAIIAYYLFVDVRRKQRPRLAWFYFLSCGITAFSAGKLGSNTNHLLEWAAALCIICGIALTHLQENRNGLAKPFAAALLLLSTIFSFMLQNNSLFELGGRDCTKSYAFVRSFPGDQILSEDVSSLVLGGKPVLVSNPFVMTQLRSSVHWRAGNLESLADHQYFDLIVLGGAVSDFRAESGRWSPELMQIIQRRYLPEMYFRCYYSAVAYVPRKAFGH